MPGSACFRQQAEKENDQQEYFSQADFIAPKDSGARLHGYVRRNLPGLGEAEGEQARGEPGRLPEEAVQAWLNASLRRSQVK
jgi:hypothetical protein